MYFAYWMILAAAFLPYACTAYAKQGTADNHAPRLYAETLTGPRQRADWAQRNHFEVFPLFAAALIACVMVGKTGPQTLYGAVLYVVARALYVPLYASGVSIVRTLVWTASVIGIVMVIVAFFR